MPKKPPPVWPKGTRPPNSGRSRGTPNRITVEVRELVAQLMNDVAYQHKLRDDFRRRKVHPTIESLIWMYYLGKPKQTIDLNAALDVGVAARVEEERRGFALLDIGEMEALAAESQALVDRALALSRARIAAALGPQPNVIEPARIHAERLPEAVAGGSEVPPRPARDAHQESSSLRVRPRPPCRPRDRRAARPAPRPAE